MILTKGTDFAATLLALDFMLYEEQSRKVGNIVYYCVDIDARKAKEIHSDFKNGVPLVSSKRLIEEYKHLINFTKKMTMREDDIDAYALDLGMKIL